MSTTRYSCLILLPLLLLPSLAVGDDSEEVNPATQASYRLQTSTFGSAGSPGTTTGYESKGTLGQPTPIGKGSAADKILYAGFWLKPWISSSVLQVGLPGGLTNNLFQNFPNPFSLSTAILYTVAREDPVEIAVFNVRGQRMTTLVRESTGPGRYRVHWDGRDARGQVVSPGVYFYRLTIGSYKSVRKMLVLR